MNQILSMREKRASLWDAAKKYRDAYIGEDGTMSAENAATYDRMVEDVDRMKTEIERMERQQAIDAELNQPTSNPITGKPMQPNAEEKQLYVPSYAEAYTLPAATADALGGVVQVANQADSTAASIATLKEDFNTLLAALKTVGIMVADTPAE